MPNQEINIVIKAVDKFTKNFSWLTKWLDNISRKAQKNTATFQKMAGFWTAWFVGIGYWIKKLVDQASDLEETTQKFSVVYKDMWNEAEKTAKKLAKWYWLSDKASKQFLADLWDVTSWFWMSQKASLKYAEEVTKLWVDLASFANIAWWSEEAVERLNKLFLWEHENLKALWIIINDTMLKKQLLADWTSELTWLELEQAKIQARMTIAYSQSKNAIWDFERSKSSLANQTRILQANMDNLTTNLWNAFLPIINSIVTNLVPVINSFASWASENEWLAKVIWLTALAITWLIAIAWTLWLIIPVLTTWFWALGVAITVATWPIWLIALWIAWLITLWVTLYKNWDIVKEKAIELWTYIYELNEKYWWLLWPIHLIVEAWKLLYNNWDLIKEKSIDVVNVIVESWWSLASFFSDLWDWIVSYASEKIDQLKSALQVVKDVAREIATFWTADTKTFNSTSWSKAYGWPVAWWKSYWVGERWPELFTPQVNGNITSNDKLNWGQTFNINVTGNNISNSADEDRLAQKILDKLNHNLQISQFGIS